MPSTEGFNFETLKSFQAGLQELDAEKVRIALDAGVSPSTYLDNRHPLHFILRDASGRSAKHEAISLFDFGLFGRDNSASSKDYDKKSAIIDLLLKHKLSLLEKIKESEERVVDSILLNNDAILVSRIIFAAIKEAAASGETYKIDFQQILEHSKPPEGASILYIQTHKGEFEKKLKTLEEIHGYVRMVIQNPSAEDRKFISEHGDKLTYWTDDFKGPDQELVDRFFPIDQEALDAAKKAAKANPAFMFGRDGTERNPDRIITLKKEDPREIMKEIEGYTGMEKFKQSMQSLIYRIEFDKARRELGLAVDVQNFHTAFVGNPGTGKTTCSRLKARLLHSLGMTGPRYLELSRDGIISKYLGNTEGKVKKLIDNVDILFVDEAYSLVDGAGNRNDYGYRAVDTIVAAMGNRKDAFTLFVAGYKEPMERFIKANEGLASRIKVFEEMRDFTVEELGIILDNNLTAQNYTVDPTVRRYLSAGIEEEKAKQGDNHFGNARVVVSLVQDLPNHMALRLAGEKGGKFDEFDAAALSCVTRQDVKGALERRGIKVELKPELTAVQSEPERVDRERQSPGEKPREPQI